MGNRLPFLKKSERRRNDSDQPSPSVEEARSTTPRAAGPITLEPHTHLEQGQLHSPPSTTTTSRPVNVSSVAEPKGISDQDETKTLKVAEQSQVPLHMKTDVPANPVPATTPGMESGQRPKTSVAVSCEDCSRTGHSTRTGKYGGSGTGKIGHSTRTKRKRKTATRKRQHGELRFIVVSLFLFLRPSLIIKLFPVL